MKRDISNLGDEASQPLLPQGVRHHSLDGTGPNLLRALACDHLLAVAQAFRARGRPKEAAIFEDFYREASAPQPPRED